MPARIKHLVTRRRFLLTGACLSDPCEIYQGGAEKLDDGSGLAGRRRCAADRGAECMSAARVLAAPKASAEFIQV
jgi:hypothetical protein